MQQNTKIISTYSVKKEGKPFGLCHKTPHGMEPQRYAINILKTNKKDIEISKYRQTGNGRGCDRTTNTGKTGNRITTLRESGIKSPKKRRTHLREILI